MSKHRGRRDGLVDPGLKDEPADAAPVVAAPLESVPKLAGLTVMITTLSRELAVKPPCEVAVNGKPLAANLWAVTTDGKIGIGADAGARPGDVVRVCFKGISPTFFRVENDGGATEIPRADAEAEVLYGVTRKKLRAVVTEYAARIAKVCFGGSTGGGVVAAGEQVQSILHDFAREILSASGGMR